MLTIGTTFEDGGLVTASVTEEMIGVGVKGEGEKTGGAEGLPATAFAERKGGGAAAIMKNEGLIILVKISFNFFVQWGAEILIDGKIVAIFDVNEMDGRRMGVGFSLFSEGDIGVVGFGEAEIGHERGGGALNTRDI